MNLVVLKFGGSSVGSTERIAHVADLVAKRRQNGVGLVVVVSAMKGETDRLLGLANAMCDAPDLRETDQLVATGEQVSAALLAMALKARGIPARSMNAAQMRLLTDGTFSRARIVGLDKQAIFSAIEQGEVVVATGFQGVDKQGNLTTLGRGGSDTSAVAIAAGLKAQECDIYTDVDGVYTADPNICPTARKLDTITFDEMMEMASLGSKVLQIRSVELAMNHNIPLRVRSTFSDDPGTIVKSDDGTIERLVVSGISHNKNEAKVTLRRVPDRPGVAATVFSALAQAQINVDVIVQNISKAGTTDLSFTVGRTDKRQAEEIIETVAKKIGAENVEVTDEIGKVSIVGVGMMAHPGVAAVMFEALAAAKVNIQMITTSEIKVTCVIDRDDTERAVRALHDAFELHKAPVKKAPVKKAAVKKTAVAKKSKTKKKK